jgi:hypothetical protein
MTVVDVIGHHPGVQHEQAAGRPAIVGDNGDLDAELVALRCTPGAWKE